MKRRIHHRYNRHIFRDLTTFFQKNALSVGLTAVLCFGIVLGVVFYTTFYRSYFSDSVFTELDTTRSNSLISIGVHLLETGFYDLLLLVVLFLAGMSAFGIPIAIAILLTVGYQSGIEQCSAFQHDPQIYTLLISVPYILINYSGILIASVCTVRLSCMLTKQLLPNAVCGGIWGGFRKYLLWYCLCMTILLIGAFIQSGMKYYL